MLSTNIKGVDIHIGDTVKVKTIVYEGDKSRIQSFEGLLIALGGRGANKTMTIRRVGAKGVGVERIWPLDARSFVGVEKTKAHKRIRRSKLYYTRNLTGRAATKI